MPSPLSADAVRSLKGFLSSEQINDSPEYLKRYGKDWQKRFGGNAGLVVFPKSREDILSLIEWAKKHSQKLVPSGGRTGLSGGACAQNKEVIVSFDKMNKILEFDPFEQSVVVQPGVITQELKNFALHRNLFFPISFAAEGSSQIGGNIATNAGGAHVLRYGLMRDKVLGLEVVTGRGDALNLGKGLVKNATGYSLMELFIGSEGTLGFITKAILKLTQLPSPLKVFLLQTEEISAFLPLFQKFKTQCHPTAFEVFTDKGLNYVLKHNESLKSPFQTQSPFYILVEIEQKQEEKALLVFEKALSEGLIQDGLPGETSSQSKALWALRENISESLEPYSPYKNDISIRTSQMVPFLKEVELLFKEHYPDFSVVWFGHLGDGNLHINILKPKNWKPKDFLKQCETVNPMLFSLVRKFDGSISAEHGIGLLKKPYLHYSRSGIEIDYMRQIKRIFDPQNIINPGKIFSFDKECEL